METELGENVKPPPCPTCTIVVAARAPWRRKMIESANRPHRIRLEGGIFITVESSSFLPATNTVFELHRGRKLDPGYLKSGMVSRFFLQPQRMRTDPSNGGLADKPKAVPRSGRSGCWPKPNPPISCCIYPIAWPSPGSSLARARTVGRGR